MNKIKTKISNLIKNPLLVTITIISSIYLLLLLAYFILVALSNGINMDTYAANGTFQLYNPLRRLLDGQIIARDFPFFHGVGVPLLHYPAFYILGHNVFAAETAKWLVSGVLFLASTLLFFFAFFKRINIAIIASSFFAVLAVYCIDVVYPGNSLLSIRTTFPILVGAFMLWSPSMSVSLKARTVNLYPIVLFILLSLAFACGAEQGLGVIAAYLILRLIVQLRSSTSIKLWWWRYSLEAITLGVTLYIVLSILTLGHANEALHYALIDIPKDQGWYFGAPPNGFLAWNTLYYILNERVLRYIAPVVLFGLALIIFALKSKVLNKSEQFVIFFLTLYGAIVFAASITGYWAPEAQLVPLARVLGLVTVGVGLRLLLTYSQNINNRQRIKYVSLVILIIASCLLVREAYLTYRKVSDFHIKDTISAARLARHSNDKTYLSANWKDRINAFTPYIHEGATVWSTYTSVYDSINNQLNSSSGGEDYIIHALGPERRNQYAQDFIDKKPNFAITLKPTYFPYEEWLWSRHWSFYKELITNYEIIADNGSHILWRRAATITPEINQSPESIKQTQGKYSMDIGASDVARVYEVTVKYSIDKPVPLSDKVSRYLIELDGTSAQNMPISLPPYLTEWTFPIIVSPTDTKITLTPKTYGLQFGSRVNVKDMNYTQVSISQSNSFMIYNNFCSFGGAAPFNLKCGTSKIDFNYYKERPQSSLFSQSL